MFLLSKQRWRKKSPFSWVRSQIEGFFLTIPEENVDQTENCRGLCQCFLQTERFRDLFTCWLNERINYWFYHWSSLLQRKLPKLFFHFSWKLPYLVISDQVLQNNDNIWVMGHGRRQWVGIGFSCSGGKSPLRLFRSQGVFINDLQVCVWWWGVMCWQVCWKYRTVPVIRMRTGGGEK